MEIEELFFIKSGDKAMCVICNETVAVMKEYNLLRHYQSKHEDKYAQFEGKDRAEKFSKLEKSTRIAEDIVYQILKWEWILNKGQLGNRLRPG